MCVCVFVALIGSASGGVAVCSTCRNLSGSCSFCLVVVYVCVYAVVFSSFFLCCFLMYSLFNNA